MKNINELIVRCLDINKNNDCFLSEIQFSQQEIENCSNEILKDIEFINKYNKYGIDIISEYIESFLDFNTNFYYDSDCKYHRK